MKGDKEMTAYVIKIRDYNHVSGVDVSWDDTEYTNINTAKRRLVELALEDENLWEEDASAEISKDMKFARIEGRHDDYCEYTLEKVVRRKINEVISAKVTQKELQELIQERLEESKHNITIEVNE